MLTRDEVIWGFRFCLGRDPETEEVIAQHAQFGNIAALRDMLLHSEEFFMTSSLFEPKWILAPVFGGDKMMWLSLGDRNVSIECLHDRYEPAETEFVKFFLRKGNVFLDIGANIGWFTLLASGIVGPEGHVHAFEPRGDIRRYLSKSVEVNALGGDVTIDGVAISDRNGSAFLSWAQNTSNPGHSFVADRTGPDGMISEHIQLKTLDSLDLPRVDFIKIDVEGSEHRAMIGAAETLRKNRPIILSEINPSALAEVSNVSPSDYLAFFTDLNYRAFIIGDGYDGNEMLEFPGNWHRDLMNVGLFPREKFGGENESFWLKSK